MESSSTEFPIEVLAIEASTENSYQNIRKW